MGRWLYLFTHPAVAHNGAGVVSQNFMTSWGERKWLMRSGSPLGDVGLPGSRSRRFSLPGRLPSIPLPYVLPWPSPYSPPSTPAKLLWRSINCTNKSIAQNLLLHCISKGWNMTKCCRPRQRVHSHTCDLNFAFVSDADCQFGPENRLFWLEELLLLQQQALWHMHCIFTLR